MRAAALLLGLALLPVRASADDASLGAFLDRLDARLEALDTARQLEFYYQLRGSPAPNLAAYQDLHRELFMDRKAAARLEAGRKETADPVLRRRAALYLDQYLDFMYDTFRLAWADPAVVSSFTALQASLNKELTSFKPLYKGERVGRSALTDALRLEPDRALRREAYLAGREISAALAPRLRELLLLTAAMHKQMGFAGTVECTSRVRSFVWPAHSVYGLLTSPPMPSSTRSSPFSA